MKALTIKLKGPMQAYGNQANFKYRTIYRHPSKSAVLGMIAAALGYGHGDSRIVKLNQLSFAVRTDQIDKELTDFQIVQVPKSSNKLTYRDYWQDAIFIAAIGGRNDQIEAIDEALHHPKFQLFLGRKSTPPAGPLETKIYTGKSPVEVLKEMPWQASHWFMVNKRFEPEWRAEIHADAPLLPGERNSLVKDAVKSFSLREHTHTYRSESVTSVWLNNPAHKSKPAVGGTITNQDVMSILK